MKKALSLIFCVLIVAAVLPFSASAASSADFKLSVTSQNDKTATVVFSFAGGTGFSALDVEIKYNKVKLSLEEKNCQEADGVLAFVKASSGNGGVIKSVNAKENPIRYSFATLEPFRAINGDGSILKITFSKIPGTKLTESDITVTITNCQSSDFKDIGVSVTTDLTGAQGNTNAGTEYAQNTSVDGKNEATDSEIGESVQPSGDNANGESGSGISQAAEDSDKSDVTSAEKNVKEGSSAKKIIIIVAAIVCVAGVGAVIVLFVKNSKKNGNEY